MIADKKGLTNNGKEYTLLFRSIKLYDKQLRIALSVKGEGLS